MPVLLKNRHISAFDESTLFLNDLNRTVLVLALCLCCSNRWVQSFPVLAEMILTTIAGVLFLFASAFSSFFLFSFVSFSLFFFFFFSLFRHHSFFLLLFFRKSSSSSSSCRRHRPSPHPPSPPTTTSSTLLSVVDAAFNRLFHPLLHFLRILPELFLLFFHLRSLPRLLSRLLFDVSQRQRLFLS